MQTSSGTLGNTCAPSCPGNRGTVFEASWLAALRGSWIVAEVGCVAGAGRGALRGLPPRRPLRRAAATFAADLDSPLTCPMAAKNWCLCSWREASGSTQSTQRSLGVASLARDGLAGWLPRVVERAPERLAEAPAASVLWFCFMVRKRGERRRPPLRGCLHPQAKRPSYFNGMVHRSSRRRSKSHSASMVPASPRRWNPLHASSPIVHSDVIPSCMRQRRNGRPRKTGRLRKRQQTDRLT